MNASFKEPELSNLWKWDISEQGLVIQTESADMTDPVALAEGGELLEGSFSYSEEHLFCRP